MDAWEDEKREGGPELILMQSKTNKILNRLIKIFVSPIQFFSNFVEGLKMPILEAGGRKHKA